MKFTNMLISLSCGIVLLQVISFGAGATYSNTRISNGVANREVDGLPLVDAIGGLTEIFDRVVTYFYPPHRGPNERSCKSVTLAFAGSEFKITQRPRGHCPYCCPLAIPAEHITLYFSTKSKGNATIPIPMIRKAGTLRAIGVDKSLPTVIYIHGFTEHGRGVSARMVRDAYLSRKEDYNIILLDWGALSSFPWYPVAASNTRIVGALLGQFLKFYDQTGELPISKLHIVGFSLGSHIAGFAGKALGEKRKIPRITALDPAFPMFSLTDTSQRISINDATYIDVIHTDAGAYGIPISVGHADFYPNGGSFVQPGCELSTLSQRSITDHIILCGHLLAVRLYVESVRNPTGFPATKCGIVEKGLFRKCGFITHAYMGFPASKSTTIGNFYLTTNNHAPFARPAKDQVTDMKTVHLKLS